MKRLRNIFDKLEPHFSKGGKFSGLYYLYEVFESFFFSANKTKTAPHVRDAIDLKRVMITVVIAGLVLPTVTVLMFRSSHRTAVNRRIYQERIIDG